MVIDPHVYQSRDRQPRMDDENIAAAVTAGHLMERDRIW